MVIKTNQKLVHSKILKINIITSKDYDFMLYSEKCNYYIELSNSFKKIITKIKSYSTDIDISITYLNDLIFNKKNDRKKNSMFINSLLQFDQDESSENNEELCISEHALDSESCTNKPIFGNESCTSEHVLCSESLKNNNENLLTDDNILIKDLLADDLLDEISDDYDSDNDDLSNITTESSEFGFNNKFIPDTTSEEKKYISDKLPETNNITKEMINYSHNNNKIIHYLNDLNDEMDETDEIINMLIKKSIK